MDAQTTIYPYEIFVLLEELTRERFSGTLTLEADGGDTVLFLNQGTVRYVRTTRIMSSFSAYLFTERIFPKVTVKGYLKLCTEAGLSLEQFLVEEGILTGEDLAHLKRDLARSTFARTFCQTGTVELRRTRAKAREYRQQPLNPFEAMFRCVKEHPDRRAMSRALEEYDEQRMRRGPDFFGLLPLFRQYFGRTQLVSLLDKQPTIEEVREAMGQKGSVLGEVFAMHLSGMVHFETDLTQRSPMRRLATSTDVTAFSEEGPARPERAAQGQPGHPGEPVRIITKPTGAPMGRARSAAGQHDPDGAQPVGVAVAAAGRERTDPGFDGGGGRPRTQPGMEAARPPRLRREPSSPGVGEARPGSDPGGANFRDILVGESLLGAADEAERVDHYTFFNLSPDAPFSQLRAAYLAAWMRYSGTRYDEYSLSDEGVAALDRLQQHIEEAYEVLTDLERRAEHDARWGVDGEVSRADLERMFEAEERFREAQLRLADGDNGEAVRLLLDAVQANPQEPEYLAYLAWGVTSASMWGHPVPADIEPPTELLDRALRMDPKLESAWVFRARIAELAGDLPQALRAFVAALQANPDNEEASEAVERLRAAGHELKPAEKASLEDRLGSIMRRFNP